MKIYQDIDYIKRGKYGYKISFIKSSYVQSWRQPGRTLHLEYLRTKEEPKIRQIKFVALSGQIK